VSYFRFNAWGTWLFRNDTGFSGKDPPRWLNLIDEAQSIAREVAERPLDEREHGRAPSLCRRYASLSLAATPRLCDFLYLPKWDAK